MSAAPQESFSLLRDDSGNETFLGPIVEGDGIGNVFGIALFEEGTSADFPAAVGHRPCIEHLPVEVDLDVVGFEGHVVVDDAAVVVELRPSLADVERDGVLGEVVDDMGDGVGRDGDEAGGGCFFCRGVGDLRC